MYSKTVIVGYVGKEPEMRFTPSGVAVTTFSVATSRKWTGTDGQPQEKTTWFRVTVWKRLAETCAQYVKKGMRILCEGEIEAQAFTDRDGNARASLELTADTVRFLSARDENGPTVREGAGVPVAHDDDEIPF